MLETLLKVFRELGVSTGLLLVIILAGWSSTSWVCAHVVEPIVTSQTKMIDAQTTLINELRSSEGHRNNSLDSIAANQIQITKNQERIADTQQSILVLINGAEK